MSELIEHEFRSNEEEPATQLMCIRGLLILLINEHLADFSGQGFCERIMSTFLDVISGEITNEKMEIKDQREHSLAIQYMSVLSKNLLHEYVMQMQNILTLNII